MMAKSEPQIDVMVLGEHPSAYLAAALLRFKSKCHILHCSIPGEASSDRLVMINPAFFALHPLLENLRRKLDVRNAYGLQFLADDAAVASEHRSKSAVTCIARLKEIRDAMCRLAEDQGAEFVTPRQLQIHRVDERGVEMTLDNRPIRPKALVVGGALPAAQRRLLGIPEQWERGVVHRYSYYMTKALRLVDVAARPLVPMSLDLCGRLCWAWLLPGDRHLQLAVEQPIDTVQQVKPCELLSHWAKVLHSHRVLKTALQIPPETIESIDMPMSGALAHEGLANRTLLIGPAGGFYSACGEDIYPTSWSAVHAADIMKKALKEPHLQDALQPYRQRWRTTLGDYLRGPQQNLRFLLPLVYRNQAMTDRLAEAILMGKSVIR